MRVLVFCIAFSLNLLNTKKNIDNLLSMPLDYVDVDERLEILRKSSLAYLEQALKGIEL